MEFSELVLEVHFDFKKEGNTLFCGYIFREEGETVDSGLVEYDITKRLKADVINKRNNPNYKVSNNYHYSLTSYFVAVEKVKKFLYENNDYNRVIYCNQNQLIFDWVNDDKRKIDNTYKKIIQNIREELHKVWLLVGDNVIHECMKIAGTKNEAKKSLNKLVKVKNNEAKITSINISEFDIKPKFDFKNNENVSVDLNGDLKKDFYEIYDEK